ncbi:MAG: hypothetical protein ACPLZD_06520 [Candidatus Saccharicenans sp.]|nr:MAG: hypothetical protein C0168_01640 [Candidatus Aminicenantes bacterium]HEK86802.1 hypothetical protein [Candidatus Aminicenantes bacterium]
MESGVFIVLYDEDTLKLYLAKGVYGFLMPPIYDEVPLRSRHYHALGDYACIRKGTHIFFFLRRKIYYGGQAIGSENHAAFYLNGQYSPLGKKAEAKLCWDESEGKIYRATDKPGIFEIKQRDRYVERCQPYLIRFEDHIGLKGRVISSDELYFELGRFPYPLPTNVISGMSFCTMTPGEVSIALDLLKSTNKQISTKTDENIELIGEPLPFSPSFGFKNIEKAMERSTSEAHLEAMLLANPTVWPEEIKPRGSYVLCRQVPMSPFKPPQWIDKANICLYQEPLINNGTIPNVILELKVRNVSKTEVEQVVKYARWLHMVLKENAYQVQFYLCGPSFAQNIESCIPDEYKGQIKLQVLG